MVTLRFLHTWVTCRQREPWGTLSGKQSGLTRKSRNPASFFPGGWDGRITVGAFLAREPGDVVASIHQQTPRQALVQQKTQPSLPWLKAQFRPTEKSGGSTPVPQFSTQVAHTASVPLKAPLPSSHLSPRSWAPSRRQRSTSSLLLRPRSLSVWLGA